jgi:hypothetical protein
VIEEEPARRAGHVPIDSTIAAQVDKVDLGAKGAEKRNKDAMERRRFGVLGKVDDVCPDKVVGCLRLEILLIGPESRDAQLAPLILQVEVVHGRADPGNLLHAFDEIEFERERFAPYFPYDEHKTKKYK